MLCHPQKQLLLQGRINNQSNQFLYYIYTFYREGKKKKKGRIIKRILTKHQHLLIPLSWLNPDHTLFNYWISSRMLKNLIQQPVQLQLQQHCMLKPKHLLERNPYLLHQNPAYALVLLSNLNAISAPVEVEVEATTYLSLIVFRNKRMEVEKNELLPSILMTLHDQQLRQGHYQMLVQPYHDLRLHTTR